MSCGPLTETVKRGEPLWILHRTKDLVLGKLFTFVAAPQLGVTLGHGQFRPGRLPQKGIERLADLSVTETKFVPRVVLDVKASRS
jgi:hypothetical protein